MKQTLTKKILTAIGCVACAGMLCITGGTLIGNRTNAEEWSEYVLNDNYIVGTYVEIPSLSVKVGNDTVQATYSVTYPDQTAVDTQRVYLSQAGVYSVQYYATLKGKHYSTEKEFTATALSFATGDENSETKYGVYPDYDCATPGADHLSRAGGYAFVLAIDRRGGFNARKSVFLGLYRSRKKGIGGFR